MKFEAGKRYNTRGGKIVTITAVDGGVLHGEYTTNFNNTVPSFWMQNGRHSTRKKSPLDIVGVYAPPSAEKREPSAAQFITKDGVEVATGLSDSTLEQLAEAVADRILKKIGA